MTKELLDYFNGDELAATVWLDKYAQKGEKTPDDMHKRMAIEFARIEEKYQKDEDKENPSWDNLSYYGRHRDDLNIHKIYGMFQNYKYVIPQGRIMAGLGVDEGYRSLSNCLRLPPPKDSYSSIMYSDTMLISAAKRGCGYGLGLSNIRPKGIKVRNASSTSTGPVSFMPRYSNSTREVAQDGRRGACLEDLDIIHPDSLDFINSKIDRSMITGANISVKTWNKFFEAVEADGDYILRFPCDVDDKSLNAVIKGDIGYELLPYNELHEIRNVLTNDNETIYVKKIKAKEYFEAIVQNAWENAEPGLFFWDRVIDYDPSSVYSKYYIDGTNACGEQPMAIFDTCRLILLNLYSYIKNPFTSQAEVDFDLLYKMAYEQMRLGDNLVDLEIEYIDKILAKIESDKLPEEEKAIEKTLWEGVRDMAESGRRVGCGITALGDMLAALNLAYDSDEALEITDKVMATKMRAELDCSIDLAILRGTFKGWDVDLEYKTETVGNNSFYQFITEVFHEQALRMQKNGRRNVNWSTIAPAGSVSTQSQSTSGCEPLFQPYYIRRKKINPSEQGIKVDFTDQNGDCWQEFPVLHPKFKDWVLTQLDKIGKEPNVTLLDKKELEMYFKMSPWYGSTANDVDWVKRVDMQAVLQDYTSSAISSTINLPNNVAKEEVARIYMTAWKKGLKGVTVYRDGCRTGVLISETSNTEEFTQHDAPKRPKSLPCEIHQTSNRGNNWLVVVGLMNEKPYEVFCVRNDYNLPRGVLTGDLVKANRGHYRLVVKDVAEIEELTSEATDEQEVISRLLSTSLRHGADIKFVVEQLNKAPGDITSYAKAMARVLKKYIPDGTKSTVKCLECDSDNVIFEEGCSKCLECGSSKCG